MLLRQHFVGICQSCRVFPVLIVQVNTSAVHKTGHCAVALEQGNNLVVNRPGPAVWLVLTKMQGICPGIHLLKRASGVTAAGDKLPHQRLGGKPLLIIVAGQVYPVSHT